MGNPLLEAINQLAEEEAEDAFSGEAPDEPSPYRDQLLTLAIQAQEEAVGSEKAARTSSSTDKKVTADSILNEQKERLSKLVKCDCAELWEFVIIAIPLPGVDFHPLDDKGKEIEIPAYAVKPAAKAYRDAAGVMAQAAEHLHGTESDDLGVQGLALSMVLTEASGGCPPTPCPVAPITPEVEDALTKSLGHGSAKSFFPQPKTTHAGPFEFRGQQCIVVESVKEMKFAIPTKDPAAPFIVPVKFILRSIYCFYMYPPPNTPPSPGGPNDRDPGPGGPTTPPNPPPTAPGEGPTTQEESELPLPPVPPGTTRTGRGRRRGTRQIAFFSGAAGDHLYPRLRNGHRLYGAHSRTVFEGSGGSVRADVLTNRILGVGYAESAAQALRDLAWDDV